MRNVIFRLDYFSALGECAVNVTLVAHHFGQASSGLLRLLFILVRVVSGVRSIVPVDLQTLAAFERGPGIVRDDRDAAERLKPPRALERIDGNRLAHAPDFQRFLIVKGFHFPAQDWWPLDGGIDHAVHLSVHTVAGFSGHHLCEFVTGGSFSNVEPCAFRFEFQLGRFRCTGSLAGSGSELAISQAASR